MGKIICIFIDVKSSHKNSEDKLAIQTPTKLAKLIQDNLLKFPHCILLTRVGGFYEVGLAVIL